MPFVKDRVPKTFKNKIRFGKQRIHLRKCLNIHIFNPHKTNISSKLKDLNKEINVVTI